MKYTKKMWLVAATIIVIAGVATLQSCRKEQVLNKTQDNIQIKKQPVQKTMRIDWFISAYDGQTYPATSENWELFERYGGYFYYYDSDGTRHWYWPYTYDPYWRPGLNNNSNPPAPSGTPLGKFVRNTIVDMMNSSTTQRQVIVSDNLSVDYEEGISLSTVIDSNVLINVANGNYVIQEITETCEENASQVIFEYELSIREMTSNQEWIIEVPFIYTRGDN